jgi:uncharacterized protein YndB with AHSA1/START domain
VASETRHISVLIKRPAQEVYDYAADPRNLPTWAQGLGSSVEHVDGAWVAESPMGRVTVSFTPPNEHFVLDHDVTLPTGETVHNPIRVLRHDVGSEVLFSLRRRDGVTDEEFAADTRAVAADLIALQELLEA